jgi:pimeloyl-ACP methyl ester carboxylesterase
VTIAVLTLATVALSSCTQTVRGHGHTDRTRAGTTSPGGTPTPAPTGDSPAVPAPKIHFTGCGTLFDPTSIPVPTGLQGQVTFGCGRLEVPLNYAEPGGKTITLELVKIHDERGGGTGSLLVNPGGPGGSGVELALGLVGQMSPRILENFDLIGFDPRGVGLSSPILCTTDAEKDRLNSASPDVLTATGFAAAKAQAKKVAEQCESKHGAGLAQYNTVNTARDMDLIRRALGESHMDYLGFSYGTELGSVYAHYYPKTVRTMVLDGAVDPLTSDIDSFANQLKGFEGAFDQFAAYCEKTSPCKSLGNPRTAVYAVVAAARKHPLQTGTARPLTVNLALTGVLEALYSKASWSKLGQALIAAGRGEGSGLLDLADEYNQRYNGQYSNLMDANLTISCNDAKPGPSDATVHATAKAWSKTYPMFGTWAAASLFACQSWQPVRTVPPKPSAPTPTKVLVIGNLHDPATPYQGAKDLAKTMGNAELLSWDGEGHTSYLSGSTCIDKYVTNYLVSKVLPPTSTTCPR